MPEVTGENRNPDGTFKEGFSGNPEGRPKDSISLTTKIKQRLALLGPDQKRQVIEHLADNMVQDALEGKNGMDKLIWAYLDGLPVKPLELGQKSDLPFIIKVIKDDRPANSGENS